MATNDTTRPHNPLSTHDVRRLAPAALDVMQRNPGVPAIAAHVATMVPAANRVLIAMEELDVRKGTQVALQAASRGQTARLNDLMVGWSGLLQRDLEGFDLGAYARDASLPFDVVQKAKSLRRFVEEKGAGLSYQQELLAELTARIESAEGAARAVYTGSAELQEKQREARELSATFHEGLVSLRRAVRAVLGSRSVDYRRLRVHKGRTADATDEGPPEAAESSKESDGGAEPGAIG